MMNAARLRRSSDIAAVRAEGRTVRDASFVMRARPNKLAVTRFSVSAPRTLGRAVARNRARRRVREAFRAAAGRLGSSPGYDVVVTPRREAISADFPLLRAAAAAALASVTAR